MRAAPAVFCAATLLQVAAAQPAHAQAKVPPLPAPAHTAWLEDGVMPPPPPLPHPKRASSERRAFYARWLQSWAARRSLPQQAAEAKPQAMPPLPTTAQQKAASPSATETQEPNAATPATWTAEEIKAAEVECDELLASIEAVAERRPPMREGSCGTAVPLRVSRIGSRNGVAIEPPAIMNCKMVSRLFQWIETVAQPAARASLGAGVVRIANASSYMCRNRYNDPAEKMSQHAYANALDVSVFELSDGRRIDVKTFWGSIVASRLAAENVAPSPAPTPTKTTLTMRAVTEGVDEGKSTRLKKSEAGERKVGAPLINTPELQFLTGLHAGACGIFSTVLGPETNRAHHDHMHLDLTPRRGSAYCQ